MTEKNVDLYIPTATLREVLAEVERLRRIEAASRALAESARESRVFPPALLQSLAEALAQEQKR